METGGGADGASPATAAGGGEAQADGRPARGGAARNQEARPAKGRKRNNKGGPREGADTGARQAKPAKGAKRNKRGTKRGGDDGPQPGNRLPKAMIPKNLPDDVGNRASRDATRTAHLADDVGNRAVIVHESDVIDESFGNRDTQNFTNSFPSDSNLLGAVEMYAVGGGRGRNGRGRPNLRAIHTRGQGNVGVWVGGTLEPGLMKPRGGKESNGNVAPPEAPVTEETEVNGNRFGFIPGNGIGGGRRAGANGVQGGKGGRGKGGRGQGNRGTGNRGPGKRGQGKGGQGKNAQGNRGQGGQGGGQGVGQGGGQGGEGRKSGNAGRGRGKGRGRQGGGNRPADAS